MRHLIAVLLAVASSSTWSADAPAPTVDQQISEQHECIARADAMIRRQHEIGREAGVVDKNALYVAGADKVHCRERLTALQACKKKGTACPADPYAPTRTNYPPATGETP